MTHEMLRRCWRVGRRPHKTLTSPARDASILSEIDIKTRRPYLEQPLANVKMIDTTMLTISAINDPMREVSAQVSLIQ